MRCTRTCPSSAHSNQLRAFGQPFSGAGGDGLVAGEPSVQCPLTDEDIEARRLIPAHP
ncbi:hypothetical protein AB0D04_42530 [Streptomyces sp. NPDC048483]|uniref:hypothetical protein n=1 Tax=Streptomyces sp. NPDC048483 TaxID=3154927 RepID=UPI0034484EFE